MPLSQLEHLDNLTRHIELVIEASKLLGKRLIAKGENELGKNIIARGFLHDNSKFYGIEYDYLHEGKDVPKDVLDLAIRQHRLTNAHHPAYFGGFQFMPQAAVGELACDWYARAQEFGTGFRDYIENRAVKEFQIDKDCIQYKWLTEFVDLLLQDYFRRD